MAYDLAGRQNMIMNELGYRTTTAYDVAGRPATILDANGWLKTHTYDLVSRLTGTLYGDGARFTFAFDAVGNRTTMVDIAGVTTAVFDARRGLLNEILPEGWILTRTFDNPRQRFKFA